MVYVFLAEGFEEAEALVPVDILRRAGVDVCTVGIEGKTVAGSHRIPVIADLTEEEVRMDDLEMVVLPGGPGHTKLESSPVVCDCVDYCVKNGKYLAAICAAPSVLGHMGLLKGHRAVCFPGYENDLGAEEIPNVPVCVSGKIITARGAGVSTEFALKLTETLCGIQKSQEIRKKIQCI